MTKNKKTKVNFRWGLTQVNVVKEAAALAGIPYESWIKIVVYRQALKDLNNAASATAPAPTAGATHYTVLVGNRAIWYEGHDSTAAFDAIDAARQAGHTPTLHTNESR